LPNHPLCRVGRNCEAQTLRPCHDGSVDTNHFPARIDQWTTGVPWVERRISLDDVLDETPIRTAQRTPQRRDNSGYDARLQPQRIADGDYQLTNLQAIRVAELSHRQVICLDTHHCKIRGRVFADQLRGEFAPVRERHRDATCTVDDMAISEDIPVRRNHEARARARYLGRAVRSAEGAHHLHTNNRWCHPLHDTDDGLRESIEQRLWLSCLDAVRRVCDWLVLVTKDGMNRERLSQHDLFFLQFESQLAFG